MVKSVIKVHLEIYFLCLQDISFQKLAIFMASYLVKFRPELDTLVASIMMLLVSAKRIEYWITGGLSVLNIAYISRKLNGELVQPLVYVTFPGIAL